ncbi:hypothetical protein Pa4123_24200 [Phytohabitans aurantiacus]|uniref:Tetratrico peptide repeat group 5 domain-containing protein n=1 Tax=Phytohabitans aurantiacus TaxID=3016789 RepID=A0ABQ5QS89_9ACTN|nr:hypothetical protein Pa4123_24200 [Phytohabitans aurantiacus]
MDEEKLPTSISELRKSFEDECFYGDDRAAAEYAYVLAIRLRTEGDRSEAQRYAMESLRLAEGLPASSLEDVSSTRLTLGGVPLPERFHDGVVRRRLGDLLDS